jgi:hypothetical protein
VEQTGHILDRHGCVCLVEIAALLEKHGRKQTIEGKVSLCDQGRFQVSGDFQGLHGALSYGIFVAAWIECRVFDRIKG